MPCTLCGDIIPSEAARCPACGAWSRHRDFRALGVAVFMLLGFNAFVALGSAVSLIRLARPLRTATRDSFEPSFTEHALTSYTEVFTASAALAGITGILYVAWLWRAYGQAPGRPPYHRGWTVTGWLVPVVNLWLPPMLVHSVWSASRGDRPGEQNRATVVVTSWWVSLLSALVMIGVFPRTGAESLAQARFSVSLGIAAAAALALSAALCMLTVFQITRLQVERSFD